MPLMIDAERAREALAFGPLIDALAKAFAGGVIVPDRHHHTMPQTGSDEATLLLMPAWQQGGLMGVKIATIHPGNPARNLPAVHSTYMLADAQTGQPHAFIDADEITARRTAAVSALAARHLARPDASRLLVVGAGRVGALLPTAYRAVRPIAQVEVWNPTPARAERLVEDLKAQGFDATMATDLEAAAGDADVIACATLATAPVVNGEWLRSGTHLDLIGSFTPDMREIDDAAISKGPIVVDTREAMGTSGDLADPLARGVIGPEAISGTLSDLLQGNFARSDADEITIFKSVGTALADFAAAGLVWAACQGAEA